MLFSGRPPPQSEASAIVDCLLQATVALSTSISDCLADAVGVLTQAVEVRHPDTANTVLVYRV